MLAAGRDAKDEDQVALDDFRCSRPGDPVAVKDVEGWVAGLLDWQSGLPGRHVRLYDDEHGLAVVVAWKFYDELHQTGYFIYLVAVREDLRKEKLGRRVAAGLLKRMATEQPGAFVSWMVDPDNVGACHVSKKFVEEDPSSDSEWPHYLEYTASLPS